MEQSLNLVEFHKKNATKDKPLQGSLQAWKIVISPFLIIQPCAPVQNDTLTRSIAGVVRVSE